ncbi:hypothetical protein bcgnr5372_37390 [Bacillus luti]|nr:hypothetical protein [Bacillus cereus]
MKCLKLQKKHKVLFLELALRGKDNRSGIISHLTNLPKHLKKVGEVRCVFSIVISTMMLYEIIKETQKSDFTLGNLIQTTYGTYPITDTYDSLSRFDELPPFQQHLIIRELQSSLNMFGSYLMENKIDCNEEVASLIDLYNELSQNSNDGLGSGFVDLHRLIIRDEKDVKEKLMMLTSSLLAVIYQIYYMENIPSRLSHYLVSLKESGVYFREGEIHLGNEKVRIVIDEIENQ